MRILPVILDDASAYSDTGLEPLPDLLETTHSRSKSDVPAPHCMPGDDEVVSNAWQDQASRLAQWCLVRLVNRDDRYGGYWVHDGVTKSFTAPSGGNQPGVVNRELLEAHFYTGMTSRTIGLHALGSDSLGKWLGIDIDAHDDHADIRANETFAYAIYEAFTNLGFRPLMTESNGKGGYHIRVLFTEPIEGRELQAFGKWMVQNHDQFGHAKPPEVFPKQAIIPPGKWGNWMRLPGRHHTRPFWGRVWDGSTWLEDAAAVEYLLSLPGDDPAMIPYEIHQTDEPSPCPSAIEPSAEPSEGSSEEQPSTDSANVGLPIWAQFDAAYDWHANLEADGWQPLTPDDPSHWVRPGQPIEGKSGATLGHICDSRGVPMFYAFTPNGGIPANRYLSPSQYETGKRFGRVDSESLRAFSRELAGKNRPSSATEFDGTSDEAIGSVHPATDLANAIRFADEHRPNVRYSQPEDKWYVWDDRRWKIENRNEISRLAKQTAARLYGTTSSSLKEAQSASSEGDLKTANAKASTSKKMLEWAVKSQSRDRIRAMIDLGKSEPGIPILPEQMDGNPWLFNCRNGTLDLRTADLRPHSREDRITALCPVDYRPDATCPAWIAFLDAVFAGDLEVIRFVQRFCGYCLTGDVSLALLIVLWGSGSNGKSTFIEVLLGLLGTDYAGKAAPDLLLAKSKGSHPTEKADLKGKRFVAASETADGRRLDEATVKELTGGDTIKARRMKEDFWGFVPTHKLVMATNHKPRVTDGGDGTWRRLRLLPFAVKFWNPDEGPAGPPELEADPTLRDKLFAEFEGILAWMVEGCLEWLADNRQLTLPRSVDEATKEYKSEENLVERFVVEKCERDSDAVTGASVLYGSFTDWAKVQNERAGSQRKFGEGLKSLGFVSRSSNGTVYDGIRLRQPCP